MVWDISLIKFDPILLLCFDVSCDIGIFIFVILPANKESSSCHDNEEDALLRHELRT